MTIQIGGRALPTTRPADLEAQLIAITGCSAAENAAMIRNGSTPFQVARALHPLIADDSVSVADLVAAIDDTNIVDVRRQAQALLAEPPMVAEQPASGAA